MLSAKCGRVRESSDGGLNSTRVPCGMSPRNSNSRSSLLNNEKGAGTGPGECMTVDICSAYFGLASTREELLQVSGGEDAAKSLAENEDLRLLPIFKCLSVNCTDAGCMPGRKGGRTT